MQGAHFDLAAFPHSRPGRAPAICWMRLRRVFKTVLRLCAGASVLLLLWPVWRLDPEEPVGPYPTPNAEPWTQADRLFRTDSSWLGGDVAYSVDLGRERVLWLFGDSFVARDARADREHSTLVRNSVAIESGYDPSRACIKFYWKTQGGGPASFFPERGNTWLWPADGVRLGAKLLLFFTRVRPNSRKDSLGFENFGWTAFLVRNPDEDPLEWAMQRIDGPNNAWGVIVGAAVVAAGHFVYVFSPAEPSHDIYLLRWPLSSAANGDLASPEWWCGLGRGWIAQQKVARRPAAVFSGGSMEFSIQWDPQRQKFLEVQSVGFGASDIAIRWADRLQGPWSEPMKVYRPPESDRPDAFVYAAKAHPELRSAALAVTYVANSSGGFQVLTRDPSIYYPRFVRLWFPAR